MLIQKKRVTKEDGRLLIYYHFPDTASVQETETFQSVPAQEESVTTVADQDAGNQNV